MADINVRGYVKYAEIKKTAGGKEYAKFQLSTTDKQRDGSKKYTNFRCTDWENGPPEDGSYVIVEGRFTIEEYNGKTTYNINVKKLSVAPPRDFSPSDAHGGAADGDDFPL